MTVAAMTEKIRIALDLRSDMMLEQGMLTLSLSFIHDNVYSAHRSPVWACALPSNPRPPASTEYLVGYINEGINEDQDNI